MIEAIILAVLNPLVTKLTEDFLDRRRNKVAISELQDQVLRFVAQQREMEIEVTQTRMAVLALTRYLALTQAEIFILKPDAIELAINPTKHERAVVGHAIQDFSSSVETHLQRSFRRSQVSRPTSSSFSERSAKANRDHVQPASAEALDRFFDGFDEEIMRVRLGREDTNE